MPAKDARRCRPAQHRSRAGHGAGDPRAGLARRSRSSLRPFAFTLRRAGRRLLRDGGLWVAEGIQDDQLRAVHRGRSSPPSELAPLRAGHARAELRGRVRADGAELAVRLAGGAGGDAVLSHAARPRTGSCSSSTREGDAAAARDRWDRRSGERFVGLGARHCDPASTRPGAPCSSARTAATPGPTARPRCSRSAGSRRATARRCRGCCSSRGYGVWAQTDANGTRFDFSGERSVGLDPRGRRPAAAASSCASRRPPRGCARSAARPASRRSLPEWGYGFWKSRDVHEHQDDVLDDFDGFRAHGIPLDAIVIDSPWATQYNTLGVQPIPVPRRAGDDRADAGRRGAHRACGARRGSTSTPATARSRRSPSPNALHREPASQLRRPAPPPATSSATPPAAARSGSGGWVPARSVDFTSPAAERWWREQVKRVLALGVRGDQDGRRRRLLHPR